MSNVALPIRSHQKRRRVYGIPGPANGSTLQTITTAVESAKEKRKRHMSYNFREPEEPTVCECKYDEIHDRMDRDDCPYHGDRVEEEPIPVAEPLFEVRPKGPRRAEPIPNVKTPAA